MIIASILSDLWKNQEPEFLKEHTERKKERKKETNKQTDARKTRKYTTVREKLKERYLGYEARQTNIVVDILGGFDRGLVD